MNFAHFVVNNTIFEQRVSKFQNSLNVGSFGVIQVDLSFGTYSDVTLIYFSLKNVAIIGELEHNKMLILELNLKIINDNELLMNNEIKSCVNVTMNYLLMKIIKLNIVVSAHIVTEL